MKLQTCPDPQQLQQLVDGMLNPQTEVAVEEHLSACESCRAKVEQRIQSADWWQQARSSLRSSSHEPESDDFGHAAVDVLSLLGPTDDPDKIGRIAEYEIIGIIGRGGMGVVFKAFDPRLNRFAAIKMLLPHLAASGAARKRFAREGQAAAAVVDDYVLPIYAVSEWQGVPYLVTQYSRGTTLQKRVRTDGPLNVKEVLRLGMQTARGLAAAHAQGLVHRDVKPSNILLDGSVERAMLTDFGLARAVDDASITRTGIIAGTPQYMSPEQARGGSVDARSDLFSLGCVLYFLCTGHPPFRADNSYAILRLITDEEPPSIREFSPEIPEWLCSIVQKLMSKQAEDRYGSASEVAELLEACLAHVSNPLKNSLPIVVSRPSWRFRWNAIMSDKRILSLVAFGLVIAAFLLPWPIAAVGRDEHALIFSGVALFLAVTFAAMSRRESFSRIVLVTIGGVAGLLMVGVILSALIFFRRESATVADAEALEKLRIDEAMKAAKESEAVRAKEAVPQQVDAEANFDPKEFQTRLDTLQENGARFEPDHYLGQETKEEQKVPGANVMQQRSHLKASSRLVTTTPGLEHLKADLRTLIDLTSASEQEQWANVRNYVDLIFAGVDETRPIEVHHLPSMGEGTTLYWLPLPATENAFLELRKNLDSFGYLFERMDEKSGNSDLYRLSSTTSVNAHGWIRVDASDRLACLALTFRIENMEALRQQVLVAAPVAAPADCSFAVTMTNADQSAEAQEYRRRAFQSYRDQTIKAMAAEKSSFLPPNIREWLLTTWLEEYQLLSAEGSSMSARIAIDRSGVPRPSASAIFSASAIPETALATSLLQLASNNDAYASVAQPESSAFSLRINLPISELRKDKLQALNGLFMSELRTNLLSLNEQNESGKVATNKVTEILRQLIRELIQSGRINAFFDGRVIDARHQCVGSVVIPDTRSVTELLTLLPQISSGNQVEYKSRRAGNVDIHRVKIDGELLTSLQTIVQTDGQFFIGCDAEKIWFASGYDALEVLATHIETLGAAQPSPVAFQLNAHLGSVIGSFLNVPETAASTSNPTVATLHQVLRLIRNSIADDDDSLNAQLRCSDSTINASITCGTAILRMTGKELAEFSKENLK